MVGGCGGGYALTKIVGCAVWLLLFNAIEELYIIVGSIE